MFLDCGVLCLNFIPMIGACSVNYGFLECSCSVLGIYLVEQCSQVSGSTTSHKTPPNKFSFRNFSLSEGSVLKSNVEIKIRYHCI